ncbi:hypothetical protein C8Q73DRAFT_697649 [Cubamyces lactineus]|nr:hypothetical protein C8Q73DRAFT_697649 [Cubamyces lactineus]
MSTPPHLDIHMLLAMRNSTYTDNCCALATTSFLLYDFLLTFDKEIQLFWRKPLSAASMLFYLNRYLTLTVYILVAIGMAPMALRAVTTMGFLQVVPQALFSSLRAYAIGNQNINLATAVFLLAMAPFGFNMTQLSSAMTVSDDQLLGGCVSSLNFAEVQVVINHPVTALSRGCLIASDVIVLFITWRYTYVWRSMASLAQGKTSLSSLLLRNGSVLLLLNVLHLTATVASVSPLENVVDRISYVGEFTSPITSVLISRFLFDLRHAATESSRDERFGTVTRFDTPEFATHIHSHLEPMMTFDSTDEGYMYGGEMLETRC